MIRSVNKYYFVCVFLVFLQSCNISKPSIKITDSNWHDLPVSLYHNNNLGAYANQNIDIKMVVVDDWKKALDSRYLEDGVSSAIEVSKEKEVVIFFVINRCTTGSNNLCNLIGEIKIVDSQHNQIASSGNLDVYLNLPMPYQGVPMVSTDLFSYIFDSNIKDRKLIILCKIEDLATGERVFIRQPILFQGDYYN